MNVLCIGPVMSKAICDDYFVYERLVQKGANVAFITGQTSGQRANGMKLPPYEVEDEISINRIYHNPYEMSFIPQIKIKKALTIAKKFKPDIIHSQGPDTTNLSARIAKKLHVPLVVHVELAGDIHSTKYYGSKKLRPFRLLAGLPMRGPKLWQWCCEKADALITSNPFDQPMLNELSKFGKQVYYLPWPANIPQSCQLKEERRTQRAIYAGLLVPFKNTQQFEWIIPLILNNTPVKEFVVIGTGDHVPIIQNLKKQFKEKIVYIPSLPRIEVLKLISESYFALTPVTRGGWGFIGDCWATKTPLLMLNNVFCAKELDICIAKNPEEIVQKVKRLYTDTSFYSELQKTGYQAYEQRTAEAVGDRLYTILSKMLQRKAESQRRAS